MFDKVKDERYIRMCNCPEVQNHRKMGFENGDIFASYGKVWVDTDADTKKAKRVFDGIIMFEEHTTIYDRDLIIWLPCQHDIQDMFGYEFKFMARQFSIFVEDSMEPEKFGSVLKTTCKSMEEFWLDFYMREIHKKVWYGGKWKKIQIWNAREQKWEDAIPEEK